MLKKQSTSVLRRKIDRMLLDWKQDEARKTLLIDGARQVGKTYAVRNLGKTYESFVEINFETQKRLKKLFNGTADSRTVISRIEEELGKGTVIPGETLILLDEIQACPNARTSLKSFTENPDVDVVASGSLLGVNYADVSSYPVGYEKRVTLNSLDFEEFLWALGTSEDTIAQARRCISGRTPLDDYTLDLLGRRFDWYMAVGGMPEVVTTFVSTKDFDAAREKALEIVEQYRSDAGKYAPPRDRNMIFRTFDSVPDQLAKEKGRFMYSLIKDDDAVYEGTIGEDDETEERRRVYSARECATSIQWLVDAGIVLKCDRVTETTNPLRGNEDLFKLYMRDTGILTSQYNRGTLAALVSEDPEVKGNLGPIAENCVADLLNKSGLRTFYYKRKETEVDFILEMGDLVTGLEVKSGDNPKSKSLNSLMDRGMVQRGIKLNRGNICTDRHGIEHYPLFAAGFADSLYEKKELKADF